MKNTVSISEGQDSFPALVKAAERGGVVTVTRHDEAVACVIGHGRMSAIVETLEILANPDAMQALGSYREGKTRFTSVDAISD